MARDNHSSSPLLTARQMRMADSVTIEKEGVPSLELMERAGRAVASNIISTAPDGGRIVFVIGPGNNGGDGLVAARLLRQRKIPVTAIPLTDPERLQGDIAMQLERARKAGVKIRPAVSTTDAEYLNGWLGRSVIIVDAIFGTGLTRPVKGWFAEAIACINASDRNVFSIDIPSGLDADTGQPLGTAVSADYTLPVAAYKWGHWLGMNSGCMGRLLPPVPIGFSDETLESVIMSNPEQASFSSLIDLSMIRSLFRARPAYAHKGEFGHLWILGGSVGYTGAPRLAASGAQAVGTGLVSIACPRTTWEVVATASLEVMVHPEEEAPWQDGGAIVAGPGWGRDRGSLLGQILDLELPLVIDADGLNTVASTAELAGKLAGREATTVLTPHPGEAGRLLKRSTADVQADRLGSVLALSKQYHCWVVLKGAQTLIASPDSEVWLCPFGSVNLAVAGTGDVLAGMIGGLLAAGEGAVRAIPAVVGLHALAGEQPGWHRAGELEERIAGIVEGFRNESQE